MIECKEAAVKMTVGRNNANFVKPAGGSDVSDQATIKSIIGEYSGLSADVGETKSIGLNPGNEQGVCIQLSGNIVL